MPLDTQEVPVIELEDQAVEQEETVLESEEIVFYAPAITADNLKIDFITVKHFDMLPYGTKLYTLSGRVIVKGEDEFEPNRGLEFTSLGLLSEHSNVSSKMYGIYAGPVRFE